MKSKAVAPVAPESPYASFIDYNRHTCFRTAVGHKLVEFVEFGENMALQHLSIDAFNARFKPILNCPVVAAAKRFRKAGEDVFGIYEGAHDTLTTIINKLEKEAPIMAIIKKPAAKAPVKPAAKAAAVTKAVKAQPAPKTAPAKPEPKGKVNKPAAAAKPLPEVAKPGKAQPKIIKAAAGAARGRTADTSQDTKKISVLSKENPSREGSKRFGAFAHMLNKCKTVADYRTAGFKMKYLDMASKKGLIKLV